MTNWISKYTAHIQIRLSERLLFVLLVFWAIIQGVFLLKNGIVTSGEAEKYIREAHLFIETGRLSSPNFWLYFVQILLLSICIKLKSGFVLAIGVQLFLNLAATTSFYKVLLRLSGNKAIAFTGTALLLINHPYQEFNLYLQTESIFYSLTLLHSCYLIKIEKLTLKNVFVIAASLCLLIITRPTGLLFVPPTCIFLFLIHTRKMSVGKKITIASIFAFLFFFLLDKALSSGGELDLMLPFKNQSVICGITSPEGPTSLKTNGTSNSVLGLFYFITHNLQLFFRMAIYKTWAFFGLYRSYFSPGHNIFIIGYFLLLYVLTIANLSFWVKEKPVVFAYMAVLILMTWISVMLTCDDWHNRFFLTLSPYFILLALGFISRLRKKIPA